MGNNVLALYILVNKYYYKFVLKFLFNVIKIPPSMKKKKRIEAFQ